MAISQHGTSVLFTSHPKDRLVVNLYISHNRRTPFKPKKLSVPFLFPGVPVGLTPFRGLVPLGWRNLVPILPPAHPLGGGPCSGEVYSIQHYVIKFVIWLATGLWFSLGTAVSSTNKTDRHDITEILLKLALNTII